MVVSSLHSGDSLGVVVLVQDGHHEHDLQHDTYQHQNYPEAALNPVTAWLSDILQTMDRGGLTELLYLVYNTDENL